MEPTRPSDPCEIEDRLDDVIEQIEDALPRIHKMCKVDKKQKRRPSTDKIRRQAKSRFQELSEDPIVNSSGTDIIECDCGLTKANGALAHDHVCKKDKESA